MQEIRERESRTSGREGRCWCPPCEVWDLSPTREHLSKGLKPVKEWAVCRWKRSVFQGNQREGKCSVPGGAWGFQRTARGAVWSSTWEEKGGMRFIFTNVPVLHTSCLHLQVKKVSLLKTHLNLPSSMRLSGLPDTWAERVDTPLPCDRGYFLYYQQRMSFPKRFYSLSQVIKMSSKYRMNLQMNPRRNDANIFFHLHLGPLESGYSMNPGLL